MNVVLFLLFFLPEAVSSLSGDPASLMPLLFFSRDGLGSDVISLYSPALLALGTGVPLGTTGSLLSLVMVTDVGPLFLLAISVVPNLDVSSKKIPFRTGAEFATGGLETPTDGKVSVDSGTNKDQIL